jgi:hypothetical protein
LEEAEIFRSHEILPSAQHHSIAERIERAIRALTLGSGHGFSRAWQASRIIHPAIPYDGLGGVGASGTFEPIPQPRPNQIIQPIVPETVRTAYRQLGAMSAGFAQPINLAIERLRRSRMHFPSADTALDLGIAAEIILLHNIDSPSELKYRFALRGAYLTGIDFESRKRSFDVLRRLYDARSNAAHKGTIKRSVESEVAEFDAACTDVIRSVLAMQTFPDWDKLILCGVAPLEHRQESGV